jgi:hypothetical protein
VNHAQNMVQVYEPSSTGFIVMKLSQKMRK